jgi:dihydrofolate reductase
MITGHVFIAKSLDGYIAKSDGGLDWLINRDTRGEDHGYDNFIKDMDGIVMGRKTFEKVLTFEPWPYTVPVVVMSASLSPEQVLVALKDKVRIVNSRPSDLLKHLESLGWQKVYIDGGSIIQSFLREKLISDLVITTVPVLLGEGRKLFGSLDQEVSLTHIRTKAFPSGLVQSIYKVNP